MKPARACREPPITGLWAAGQEWNLAENIWAAAQGQDTDRTRRGQGPDLDTTRKGHRHDRTRTSQDEEGQGKDRTRPREDRDRTGTGQGQAKEGIRTVERPAMTFHNQHITLRAFTIQTGFIINRNVLKHVAG